LLIGKTLDNLEYCGKAGYWLKNIMCNISNDNRLNNKLKNYAQRQIFKWKRAEDISSILN